MKNKSFHRIELEKKIKKILPKLNGKILDIGSKNRAYDFLLKEKPIAIDLVENNKIDILAGDINNLDFPAESFDSVVCLEVLEYIITPQIAVDEIYRVLKNEGELVLSVPFMLKVHNDKMRYTAEYLYVLFKNFKSVEISYIGNFYTIILDIIRRKIIDIKFTPLRYLSALLFLPLLIFFPISRLSKDHNFISGYLIVAKK